MKTSVLLAPIIIALLWLSLPELHAQDSIAIPTAQELDVRERTILGQFESNLVEPADERLQKKLERRDLILMRRSIIDTLDITEYRRKRLLKELYRSPHSDRWERLMAQLDLENNPDE